jgi:hypothetical protein
MGEKRKAQRGLVENLKERDHLKDLGVDENIIKRNLNKMGKHGMD